MEARPRSASKEEAILAMLNLCRAKGSSASFLCGTLSLTNNGLHALPAAEFLFNTLAPCLTELLLNKNLLPSVPPEIGILSMLQRLDLEHNLLTSLPPEIGLLSSSLTGL